ncbi:hypothetical protein V865_003294 [Kwoniella europaea PYCC6329]|uniref:Uncharacterized protein n=1 Tax=Kwoniella europaea PYCC6329 TaxID=1423913 RepID=A0AAX4KFV3_9TREE
MQVRLPPSVISQIESHLRPEFQPVFALSSILQHQQPQRSPQPRSSAHESKSPSRSFTGGYGLQPFSESQPTSLSPSYLFRTSPTSHLSTAHQHLSSQPFNPASSTSLLSRQVTYSKLISAFVDHPKGLEAIISLVDRSLSETVPISIPTLTSILKCSLSTEDVTSRISVINKVLPILPERLDIPLLDVLLRAVIRDINPEVGVIEKMINDCLSLEFSQGTDTGIGKLEKDRWPLEIWDLPFTSHFQRSDTKQSLELLAEFRQIVLQKLSSTPSSSSSIITTAEMLDEKDRMAICKVYTTVLNTWRRSNEIYKIQSTFPKNLAMDLTNLMGEGYKPSMGFLNSWMKAERQTGDMNASRRVWDLIESKVLEDELPNNDSWIALFQLYSTPDKPSSVKTLPPLKTSIKRLFNQVKQYPKSTLINALTINTILKSTLSSDLPLSLYVLRQMGKWGILPDRKTVDLVSSEMMKMILRLPLSDQIILGIDTSMLRNDLSSMRSKRTRMGLKLFEWDLITEAIHNIRRRAKSQNPTGKETEVIWLPLSMPIGRIRQDSTSNLNENDQMVITSISTSEENLEKRSLPEKVLDPLMILLERLIILLNGKSSSIAADTDKSGKMEVDDEEILKKMMGKIHAEMRLKR